MGILLTVMVQSSSITTSLIVPLAGAGLLTLGQIFPFTLGANIGTTVTAFMASLITGSITAVVVTFSHLMFNICGLLLWWPIKFIPLYLASRFSELSVKNKLIPVIYIIVVFFIIPVSVIYFSS